MRSKPNLLSICVVLALAAIQVLQQTPSHASVVCANAATYAQCGRVFPDPEAGMRTDPNAEGLAPATDFIQYGTPGATDSEIWDGLKFLQARYEQYLEVWTLEDLLDDPDARSAGLWLGGQRGRLPLVLARATDETVPAEGKKRFVFGLSLHGIERAGAEGGTRALEDLVTYAFCESLGDLSAARADAVCANQTQVRRGDFVEGEGGFPAHLLPWDASSMTLGELMKKAEIYFAYVNADGWHRGDRAGGISHYQRYNGNSVDPNRDWPTQGWTYRGYTPASEPETRAFSRALKGIGGNWAGGADLHGQLNAPVLTYTMLPAGQNDYAKNARIRDAAQRTQIDGDWRLRWSPLIGDEGSPGVDIPFFGRVLPMRPQAWGTVWDTIDYTVTGAFGDWINSPVGLDGIGLDNEMSLSHVTNCGIGSCFVHEVEQLHVAGNKGIIYTALDGIVKSATREYRFPFHGRAAYLRYDNALASGPRALGLRALDLPAQEDITGTLPCPRSCTYEFDVKGQSDNVFNGGITANLGFVAPESGNDIRNATFAVDRFSADHAGDAGEWEEVAGDFRQQNPYLSNAMTVTMNAPAPGRYRLRISGADPGPYAFEILFSKRLGWEDPGQRPYRVTNLEFFDELNSYLPAPQRFAPVEANDVMTAASVLEPYDVLVLADDALPGWNETQPKKSTLSRAQHDAYYRHLRAFVRGGGTLVLLDAAMQGLPELTGSNRLAPIKLDEYAGWIGFNDGEGPTYDDPLAHNINVPGAAEGSGNRHQTYEPVPLGYQIDPGEIRDTAPVWVVDQEALEKAGGRTVGTSEAGVSLGELKSGSGSIRFAGALLPSPTDDFDHPYGLASYALTYTGWQLFENLVNVKPEPAAIVKGTRTTRSGPSLPKTGGMPMVLALVVIAGIAVVVGRKLGGSYRI